MRQINLEDFEKTRVIFSGSTKLHKYNYYLLIMLPKDNKSLNRMKTLSFNTLYSTQRNKRQSQDWVPLFWEVMKDEHGVEVGFCVIYMYKDKEVDDLKLTNILDDNFKIESIYRDIYLLEPITQQEEPPAPPTPQPPGPQPPGPQPPGPQPPGFTIPWWLIFIPVSIILFFILRRKK